MQELADPNKGLRYENRFVEYPLFAHQNCPQHFKAEKYHDLFAFW
jgi:hypothetical protein